MFPFNRSIRSKSRESGFSLTESIVALGVFALAAVPSLSLVSKNLDASAHLETRTLAAFVAENRMVETRLEQVLTTSETVGKTKMGGLDFTWERSVTDTQEQGLKQIQIKVRLTESSQYLAVLTGFWNVG